LITRESRHPDGFEWRKRYVHANNRRFQPAAIVAAHLGALSRSRSGALTHRDVKNEGASWDVYENKGNSDTLPDNPSGFLADKCKSCKVIWANPQYF
jgi:hypothetical protein